MTKDFKNMRKWNESDEEGIGEFMKNMLAICLIAWTLVIVFSMFYSPTVGANSDQAIHSMMNPDMQEYDRIYGHDADFSEMDVE